MFVLSTIITIVLIGTLDAQQPDIDISRLRASAADSRFVQPYPWRNVNDGYTSGHIESKASLHLQHDDTTFDAKNTHSSLQIHPPREDPRLFYLSDGYLQENNGQNVNNEVSFIYPGREVVRAVDEDNDVKSMPFHMQLRGSSSEHCIYCPRDKTIMLKRVMKRVKVPTPRLTTCSGQKASRAFHFVHLYGAKPGSRVEKGSHLAVGNIIYKDRVLHTCKMHIYVLEPSCRTPKYLIAHCKGDQNKTCNFKCRDPKTELNGESSLTCGDGAKWKGNIPVCTVRSWCTTPPPPRYGRVSCRGKSIGRKAMAAGSKCWVRCARGRQRWNPRTTAVCRRGAWTQELSCQKRRQY